MRGICTEQKGWDSTAKEVVLPSKTGQLGILSGHGALESDVETGEMRESAEKSENWEAIALSGGFAEVDEDEVTILVNGAEKGDSINLEEARTAFNEAQTRLNQVAQGDRQAQIQATQTYKRARARFQAAGGMV